MLIDAARACLIAVDLQERLLPAIRGGAAAVQRARLVLRAAARLDIPILASEHYPKGLGRTVPAIGELVPAEARIEKIAFSAMGETAFRARFAALERDQVVLLGTEAHVCVMQTGLGLLEAGAALYVVSDAVASREPADARAALRRLERAGATLVTAEMLVFEWLRRGDTAAFRDLLPWIKDPGRDDGSPDPGQAG